MVAFDDGMAETELPAGRGSSTGSAGAEMPVVTTDVLVVGSGPAGASAALFLSTLGVANILITKYRWTANTPRAHITNQRTMEIFRDVGTEDQVLADATPHDLIGDTVFCTSIAGEEIGRILTWGTHPAREADYRLPAGVAVADLRHPADLPRADPGPQRHRPWHADPVLHRIPLPPTGCRWRRRHRAGSADRLPVRHPGQVPDRRRRSAIGGRD